MPVRSSRRTIALVFLAVLAHVLPALFEFAGHGGLLLSEDALYESIGAAACLAAAMIFVVTYFAGRRTPDAGRDEAVANGMCRPSLWWLALAGVCFVMCGEEVSWGQRLLSLETPEWYERENVSGELNFHNLRLFYPADSQANLLQVAWLVATVAYLSLLPLLTRVWRWLDRLCGQFRVPVASGSIALAGLVNFALFVARTLWDPYRTLRSAQAISEAYESFAELLMLALAVEVTAATRAALAPSVRRGVRAVVAITLLVFIAALANRLAQLDVRAYQFLIYKERGERALEAGDLMAALDESARLIELAPEEPYGYVLRGTARQRQGAMEAAREDFAQALQVDPHDSSAWHQMGRLQMAAGELDRAIATLERARELNPNSVGLLNDLGVALARSGRKTEAEKVFREALAIDPDAGEVQENLAALRRGQR